MANATSEQFLAGFQGMVDRSTAQVSE